MSYGQMNAALAAARPKKGDPSPNGDGVTNVPLRRAKKWLKESLTEIGQLPMSEALRRGANPDGVNPNESIVDRLAWGLTLVALDAKDIKTRLRALQQWDLHSGGLKIDLTVTDTHSYEAGDSWASMSDEQQIEEIEAFARRARARFEANKLLDRVRAARERIRLELGLPAYEHLPIEAQERLRVECGLPEGLLIGKPMPDLADLRPVLDGVVIDVQPILQPEEPSE